MAWGKKLLLSLSVFAIHAPEALARWQCDEKTVTGGDLSPWLFLQLCFCSVWGRCPAERGGQTLRCAQLSARLSAELCSPDLWRYCTTLRCTESICERVRKKIVEYFKINVPQRQIAKALQISSSTVHNIIKRFRETGEISVRKDKAEDLCWMPVVFGPSDDTASLIGMILSLTLLNGPRNTSRNHCR